MRRLNRHFSALPDCLLLFGMRHMRIGLRMRRKRRRLHRWSGNGGQMGECPAMHVLLGVRIVWKRWCRCGWRKRLLVFHPGFKVRHCLGHLLHQSAKHFDFREKRIHLGTRSPWHGVFHAREAAFQIAHILVQVRHAVFETVNRLAHSTAIPGPADQKVEQYHRAHQCKRQGHCLAKRPPELEYQHCRGRQRDNGHAYCYKDGPRPAHGV
ncbi:MAG: hypothetical protein AAFN16_24165 [Pseudomonadota bacterium]